MVKVMQEHFSSRFLKHVTPQRGDPTFSILKTHLLIEDLLRTYLEKVSSHPTVMKSAKLTFAQALQVARAFCPDVEHDYWIWKAMNDLNRLRNDLAHKLQPEELEVKIEAYVSYIVTSTKIPLPEPLSENVKAEVIAHAKSRGHHEFVLYSKVDMVNIGLYSAVLGSLGFEQHEAPPKKNSHNV